MVFNHGIAFYSNIFEEYKAIVKNTIALAKGKHPEWVLSCSREDQFMGLIGFTCTGHCIAMYDCDCRKYVNWKTGEVRATSELARHRCTEEEWYASNVEHVEAFVDKIRITGFWMQEVFYERSLRNRASRARRKPADYGSYDKMFAEFEKLEYLGIPFKVVY